MRKFLKGLALGTCVAVASAVTFAGCGGGGDPGEQVDKDGFTIIRFWNGFTGADGQAMDRIVENFNAENSEKLKVKVVADKIPWDTLFTKITTTSSNLKAAPHIVAMSASRISGMQAKGVLTPMTGIEEYLGVDGGEYIEAAWNGVVLGDGVRYGFPIDVHPTAMYYNKDIVSEDEIPTTWEEFYEVSLSKTQNGVYGWAVPSMYSITKDVFLNMLYTAGGTVLDADRNPVYNSAAGVAAAERLYNYVHGENPISLKDVGAGGDETLFIQGKSAFYFDGPWVINTFGLFDNENSNIGVAPCPSSVGGKNKNFAGSHQFTLMKNTVTTDKTRNLCYTFMRYVNEHSLEWAEGGQVPALKSIHQTEEYKALTPLKAFTDMAEYSTLGEIDYEYWYECYNGMGVAVSNAISNIAKPKNALDKGVKDFKDWLVDENL